ncbi:hypothetical protein RQM47_08495 [Rubrivirga sp. S365]|uniref:Lipoprotein n=1 Tax=Rubrivirga litoralis TaxID=3075598 RepID=A0ABU3BPG2_9BACT|nr:MULTISPECIES: hypothetical protein [unclassified Rubrivirga]MDT0631181.1 hypothetical protein [Rubrivirga sp. F394]MDT7856676.1 hypothetical protein [Rubrivirga sp. S365]
MPRRPAPLAPLLAALALLPLLAACDGATVEEQRFFEDQAFSPPSGYTRTDASGAVVAEDAGDWRIGPAYGGLVQTIQVPYPNPLPFRETGVYQVNVVSGVAGGLALYRLDGDGRLRLIGQPCDDAVTSTICTFTFQGREVSPVGDDALTRLLLVDGRNGVVSYGDVQPAE